MSDAELSAIRATVDELIRTGARLESALQRNFENVNITRHGVSGGQQLIMIELGLFKTAMIDLGRQVGSQTAIMAEFREAKTEAKGGMKMAQFLYPLIAAAAGVAGGYFARP